VIRFGASGFWPVDQALWANESTRKLYWDEFDSVVEDATELKVKLIPSLLWNIFAVVDLCKEPLSALIPSAFEHHTGNSTHVLHRRNAITCSLSSAREFTSELVSRYASNPTIVHWELTNELNLHADLDMEGKKTLIAPSLGTPGQRTRLDNFSTNGMREFQQLQANWIRQHDKLGRGISTGHAIPRPNAEHLRASYHEPQRDWSLDNTTQFQTNVLDTCEGCDLCSLHVYPSATNRRWNLPNEWSLLDVAAAALNKNQELTQKRLYVGEFGVSLPDRHNSSASDCNFTAGMVAHMQTMPAGAAPVLATYWQWMAPNQAATWSIFPGQDEHTIGILQGKD
jgi:hypothetical protein